ncbi:hypothetical protein H6F44_11335 [Pseudanabaena sp. FACHB-1277]|uniref:Uncharacterized protein n=1 Tax=Pseudanabaena cinerea FACHB-1277 TaxID=2949581 RepID=A0A926UT85_9CYAN|nr:hypothetical protein [Pseudanabaena cinerea]MBD2150707.1 hypothetical protein [Pseudanabaena cinerea FACHB-1277]
MIQVADAITDGFAPNFTKNIEIEEVLDDLVKNLCTGSNARFQGILILFDELNYYLDSWLTDKHAAGNTAPQNLTNACTNHRAKITLMSFTQVDPNSKSNRAGYQQVSTRLAPHEHTHSPISSLERVIDDVIVQQDNEAWQKFRKKWDNVFWGDSQRIYKRARKYEDGQNLNVQDFHKHLGLGCFPLHPLTGYLLCNLEFTQGRTAIEFVRKEVGEFLNNAAETDQPVKESLNYIYAISLVDAFAPNFRASKTKSEIYTTYLNAIDAIKSDADQNEINVVKSIFLYTVSSDLVIKSPHESHEKILIDMTGLSENSLKKYLVKLCEERQIIDRRPDGIYQFFAGQSPNRIREKVIEELEKQLKQRPNSPSTETVFVEYCRENISTILVADVTKSIQFANENGLIASDWCFQNQIFTIEEFEKLLQKPQAIVNAKNKGCHGIVAYVVDSRKGDLEGLIDEIDNLLSASQLRDRLVVAIPKQDIGQDEENLGRILQKLAILKTVFRSDMGTPAYSKVLSEWEEQVRNGASNLLKLEKNLVVKSIRSSKIHGLDNSKISNNVSVLLKELYPYVPSVGNSSNIRLDNTASKQIVTALATWMLGKGKIEIVDLPKHNKAAYQGAIDMFEKVWGIFEKKGNEYYVKKPTNNNILAAWEMLDQLCDLKGGKVIVVSLNTIRQKLFDIPYGYHDLTFVVLAFAWLALHRSEVSLKGTVAIKSGSRSADPRVEEKELSFWATTNIVEKLDNLVKEWIIKLDAKVIRRERITAPPIPTLPTTHDQASIYIKQAKDFLDSNGNAPEANTIREWLGRLTQSVKNFDAWYKPIKATEELNLATSFEALINLYPQVLRDYTLTDIVRTPSQEATQVNALKRLQELIELKVKQLQIDLDSLTTIQDCGVSLGNTDAAIKLLQSVTALPDIHIQALEKTKSAIAHRQKTIETRQQITQKLREVQSRYEGLSQNATQQELMDAQEAIAQFAEALPALQHEAKYQETLENISERQEQLKLQLQNWDSRSLNDLSPLECIKLREELVKQESRYTFAEDKQQIKELLSCLGRKIENNQSSQVIADDNKKSINQAIERVKSIGEAKSIGQMFDNYKHLQRLHIGTHDDLDTREEETQLSQLQNSGFKTLLERIKRELAKCDLLINKLDEYNQRKNVLQQLQVFMPISEEFNDIYHEKEVAAKNLEKRYEEFLTRGKINKIIKQVNDLSVSMNSTIRNCEENLQKIHKFSAELTELSKQNNNLTIDYSEINKKIKEFDNQIAKQCEELTRLQNRIEAIADPNELDKFKIDYAKIEYIFKDSSHYANYQQFQTKIDELDDVLDIVRVLEKEIKQKSNSINECQKSQQTLAEKSKDVPDRFQPQIQAINQYLSDRLEQYRHELDDLEQRLTTITGLKQCQSLEAELSRKSNYYLGSEIDEDRYRLIQSQLSRLQELYKLADTAKRQSLEDYDQHLQTLQQWHDEDSQIPEWMGDRYITIRRETEKNRQALLDKIRKDAREWVNQVAVVESGINTDSNLERQAEDAHKLIQRIQNEKPIHILGLTEDLENTIKEIEQKCNSIIDSNLEIQIISRFRQLTQSRRTSLYTKLQDYLTDKTEDD